MVKKNVGGEDQWEAWNWSCDLRANETPREKLHMMAQKKRQTSRQTDMETLWLNRPIGANSVKILFKKINVWPELSSQTPLRIQGGYSEGEEWMDEGWIILCLMMDAYLVKMLNYCICLSTSAYFEILFQAFAQSCIVLQTLAHWHMALYQLKFNLNIIFTYT